MSVRRQASIGLEKVLLCEVATRRRRRPNSRQWTVTTIELFTPRTELKFDRADDAAAHFDSEHRRLATALALNVLTNHNELIGD